MAKGKKTCPNCNTEIGVRTSLCQCGWYYPEKRIRPDLLKVNKAPEKNKTYTSEGRGRKRCPGCKLVIGGVSKTCFSCGFDFVSVKKEKDRAEVEKKIKKQEEKENISTQGEKISPTVAKLLKEVGLHKESKRLTPKEHAERILSYGKKRASALFKLSKINHSWNHVDWKIVEQGVV